MPGANLLRVAGKDNTGKARPFAVDEDGVLQVAIDSPSDFGTETTLADVKAAVEALESFALDGNEDSLETKLHQFLFYMNDLVSGFPKTLVDMKTDLAQDDSIQALNTLVDALGDEIVKIEGAQGASTDAVVEAGATGSLSAKLRRLTTDLDALLSRIGATDDVVVDAGAVGSLAAKVRRLTTDLAVIKTDIAAIKANQLSGDQQVQLSGTKTRVSSPPVTGVKTVTGVAAELFAGASRKAGRSRLVLRNMHSSLRLRIGPPTVTDSTGFGVEPQAVVEIDIDPASDVPWYAVSEAGAIPVEVLEA